MSTPSYPTNPTPQLLQLLENYFTLVSLFTLFSVTAEEIPHIMERLKRDDLEKARSLSDLLVRIRFQEVGKYKFSHIIAEIYLSRTVDQFNSYVVDMLRAYFRKFPQQLSEKTKRGKPREVAGRGQKAPNNIDYYAMIQADKQSQDAFTKIADFLKSTINLDIHANAELIKEVDIAIGIRNIITHNRGRMNEKFLKRLNDESGSVDLPLILDQNQANYYSSKVLDAAQLIDKAFVEAFGMDIFREFSPFPTLSEGVFLGNAHFYSTQDENNAEQDPEKQ